jgi:DNA-binding NarL/FixJ family response regulator
MSAHRPETIANDKPTPAAEVNQRVLIVDDQKVSRDSIREVLKLFPNLEVIGEVESGEQAIEFLDKSKPDMVLMDIGLPGMNGLECTRVLKAHHPEIVVFVITSNRIENYRRPAIEAGASECISKSRIRKELIRILYMHSANRN